MTPPPSPPGVLLVATLLALLPLAGCLDVILPARTVVSSTIDGGPNPWCAHLASWTEPGLYDAIARLREEQGLQYAERHVEDGLPFTPPPALARAVLRTVRFDPSNASWSFLVGAWEGAGPSLVGFFPNGTDDATIREAFRAVAPAVTGADEPTLDRWEGTFLASKRSGMLEWTPEHGERVSTYQYEVTPGAPLRLQALATDLTEAGAPIVAMEHGPRLTWAAPEGRWTFEFDTPAREAVLRAPEGPLALRVTGVDWVSVSSFDGLPMDETALHAWVTRTFTAHGLPAPAFQAFEAGGAIC